MKNLNFFATLLALKSNINQENPCHKYSSNRLLDYLADSDNKKFNKELCIKELEKRVQHQHTSPFHFNNYEATRFTARFKLVQDNKSYELAIKEYPSVKDLEELSYCKYSTCWSVLFCIKRYLCDHPDLAKQYRGLQPFGRQVAASFKALTNINVGTSPTLQDHIKLRDITNYLSDMTGLTTVAVNTLMFSISE